MSRGHAGKVARVASGRHCPRPDTNGWCRLRIVRPKSEPLIDILLAGGTVDEFVAGYPTVRRDQVAALLYRVAREGRDVVEVWRKCAWHVLSGVSW